MRSHNLSLRPAAILLGLVLLALPCPALPGSADPGDLTITGNPPAPWRIAELELGAAGGILGRVEVRGVAWDGSASLLYREEVRAWTARLPIRILVQEDLRFLEAKAEGPSGESVGRLDLENSLSSLPAEAGRLRRLENLSPPFARYAEGPLPAWLDLAPSSPETAARDVLPKLTLGPRPLGSLAILAALALGAALAAGLGGRQSGSRPIPLAALALACLGLALAGIALQPREARLILVDLPPPDSRGLVSGRLVAEPGRGPERGLVRYAKPGESGELGLLVLSTPGDSAIPLGDLASPGDDLVLSGPLLIVGRGGSFEARTGKALSGWRIHGHP